MAGISNANLGPDPAGQRDPRRPAGLGAEPVLAGVPLEPDELELCAELGIAFLPWSPLGGIANAGALGTQHPAFHQVAADRGVSPQRLTLAWMLARPPTSSRSPAPAAPRPSATPTPPSTSTLTPAQVATLDGNLRNRCRRGGVPPGVEDSGR